MAAPLARFLWMVLMPTLSRSKRVWRGTTNNMSVNNPQLTAPSMPKPKKKLRLRSAACGLTLTPHLSGTGGNNRRPRAIQPIGRRLGLQPKGSIQPTLFDEPVNQAKSDNLMHVMDEINRKMGKGSVGIAASGLGHGWAMRQEKSSPNYTTSWNELPVAGCS